MTFEERLDRLTERHEALTQTVEHLALQSEEQNKQLQFLKENIDHQTGNVDRILTMVEQPAQVAASHERRLTNLEGA